MKKQTSWKMIYTEFEGMTRRAVELLNAELGKYIIRETGLYSLYVLPCVKESECERIDENAVLVGEYDKSPEIQKHVKPEELSDCDYLVKGVENPANPEGTLLIVTAKREEHIYMAAGELIDSYLTKMILSRGCLRMVKEYFDEEIVKGVIKRRVLTKTRSVFAWGHAINDYRAFIRDMARVGLNQLILWNDYAPLNARDIVDYAHSYGIEMIWGYAWGWHPSSGEGDDLSEESLKKMSKEIIEKYKREYHDVGDGIYFQSFTEHAKEYIGDRLVAEAVTALVNETAHELYKLKSDLKLQFGLHATSVRKHPNEIAAVDPRIEIVWEDLGAFPFSYTPVSNTDEETRETVDFVKTVINLRDKSAETGLVLRGFSTLDWTHGRFKHQNGPYILGENAKEISAHDKLIREDTWRMLSAEWMRHGESARKMVEGILDETKGDINLCFAAAFDGGIWFPYALAGEIVKDPYRPYNELMEIAASKEHVIFN